MFNTALGMMVESVVYRSLYRSSDMVFDGNIEGVTLDLLDLSLMICHQ